LKLVGSLFKLTLLNKRGAKVIMGVREIRLESKCMPKPARASATFPWLSREMPRSFSSLELSAG